MQSSRSRLIFDIVLIAAIVALSFPLPAQSLRIVAAIYCLFVVLGNTVLGRRSRVAVDLAFAVFLACMAWFELFAAGNHMREAAIYAAIGASVAAMGGWSLWSGGRFGRRALPAD